MKGISACFSNFENGKTSCFLLRLLSLLLVVLGRLEKTFFFDVVGLWFLFLIGVF